MDAPLQPQPDVPEPIAPHGPAEAPAIDFSDLEAELHQAAPSEDNDDAGEESPKDAPKPRRSRSQRYRDSMVRYKAENERLQAELEALTNGDRDSDGDRGADRSKPEHNNDNGENVSDRLSADDEAASLAELNRRDDLDTGESIADIFSNTDENEAIAETLNREILENLKNRENLSRAGPVRYGDPVHNIDDPELEALIANADRLLQEHQEDLAHERRQRIDTWRQRGETPIEQQRNKAAYDAALRRATELGLKVAPDVADVMMQHERLPHLVFYYANNPNELRSVNKAASQDPRMAAAMVGELAARLKLPEPKRVSAAPVPPKTRPGGGAGVPSDDAQVSAYINKTYGR